MKSSGARVLVVDDDASAGRALVRLLSAEGFDARAATSGAEALDAIATRVPDVVVTDLRMPAMDGLALLEELEARHLDVPVILASAVDDVAVAVQAIHAGAADYLTKPIDAAALSCAIAGALQTRGLVREAEERSARSRDLADEAARNVHAREELLSIVAHDLRGPLSTILLASAWPARHDDPDEVRRRLALIHRAGKHMTKLVEDLLDVARIEAGSLALDLGSHRASRLLDEAMSVLAPLAKNAGVELVRRLGADFTVRCAFDRIVQVLVNLGSNAVRVTARGGVVRLGADCGGGRASFVVEDDGPGIARDLVPHVLERGFRLRGVRCGVGLGLAIAKGIVDAHGGHLRVESAVGVGSVFEVDIPQEGAERPSWRVVGEDVSSTEVSSAVSR